MRRALRGALTSSLSGARLWRVRWMRLLAQSCFYILGRLVCHIYQGVDTIVRSLVDLALDFPEFR
jgi:hypothetical protein